VEGVQILINNAGGVLVAYQYQGRVREANSVDGSLFDNANEDVARIYVKFMQRIDNIFSAGRPDIRRGLPG
jgi:hypothetical protein